MEFSNLENGPEIKIYSRSDYSNHIEITMNDKNTECFHSHSGRTVFFNEMSNTFVVYDPNNKHNGGTCYRPDGGTVEGRKQFEREFDKDVLVYNGSPDKDRIITGGYVALRQNQAQERSSVPNPIQPEPAPTANASNIPSKEPQPADQAPAPKSVSDYRRGDDQAHGKQKQDDDKRQEERPIDRYRRSPGRDDGRDR